MMLIKELISELQKYDPDAEAQIQVMQDENWFDVISVQDGGTRYLTDGSEYRLVDIQVN